MGKGKKKEGRKDYTHGFIYIVPNFDNNDNDLLKHFTFTYVLYVCIYKGPVLMCACASPCNGACVWKHVS